MSLHVGALVHWDEASGYGEIQPQDPNPNHGLVGVTRGAFAGLPAPAVGQRFLFEVGNMNGLTAAVQLRPYPG